MHARPSGEPCAASPPRHRCGSSPHPRPPLTAQRERRRWRRRGRTYRGGVAAGGWAIHLHHRHRLGEQVAGQASAVGARPFDADALRPDQGCGARRAPVGSRRGRRERPHAELAAPLIERGDHVLVAVRVDPGRDARGRICHGGHRHPFIEQSVQGGRTCRDGGQDRDEPPRQAPMRSRSPDRCVPDGLGGAADRSEREQPKRQSESGVRPSREPTRHRKRSPPSGGWASYRSSLSDLRPRLAC